MSFTGKSAFDAAQQQQQARTAGATKVRDFYLKMGETKEVIFCDDEPEVVNGHRILVDGRPEWVTCSQGLYPCLFCEKRFNRTWIGPMTVVDVSGWTDRNGAVHRDKKLLLAGSQSLAKLRMKKDNRVKAGDKGLVGGKFSMARITQTSAFDDCEFLQKVTPAEIGVPDFKPLDYATLLAPPSREKQESMFLHSNVSESRFSKPKTGASAGGAAPAGGPAAGSQSNITY